MMPAAPPGPRQARLVMTAYVTACTEPAVEHEAYDGANVPDIPVRKHPGMVIEHPYDEPDKQQH